MNPHTPFQSERLKPAHTSRRLMATALPWALSVLALLLPSVTTLAAPATPTPTRGNVQEFDSVVAILASRPTQITTTYLAKGLLALNDGEGGTFYYAPSDTGATNATDSFVWGTGRLRRFNQGLTSTRLSVYGSSSNYMDQLWMGGAFSITNVWADIRSYGASPAAADNTAAMQAAINTGQDVLIPKGQFTNTGRLNFTNQFQRIRGVGANMSIIVFDPPSSNTCIRFGGLAGTKMFHTGFSGIQLKCVSNSVDKVGLELVDISLSKFSDFQINPWFSNGSSTNTHGMIVRGRDTTSIRDFTIYANQAVAIMSNPNVYITMDQFHWSNYEMYSSVGIANILVYPEDCFIASTTFSPYSSASAATNSFYWADAALSRRSLGLHFNGLRPEQTLSATGWQIYIDLGDILSAGGTNNILQNFTLENSYLNLDRNGVYLRGVQQATFRNVIFAMSTGFSQLDIDDSCQAIFLDNVFSQQGATASIVGLTNRMQYPKYISGPLPSFGWYTKYGTNVADNTAFVVSPGLELNGFFNINGGNFYMRDTGGAITPIRRETVDWVGTDNTNDASAIQINLSTNTGGAEGLIDAFTRNGNTRTNIAIQKQGGTVTIANDTNNATGTFKLEVGGPTWLKTFLVTGPRTNIIAPVTHYSQALYLLNSDWDPSVTGTGLLLSKGASSGDTYNSINSLDQGGASPAELRIQTSAGDTVIGGPLIIPTATPASAAAAGTTGRIAWDADFIYICIAPNTWKRVAIATW